jgi:hypothetical protein
MDFEETTLGGVDKVERYNWKLADSPAELKWLPKEIIKIDNTYQRSLIKERVKQITANWSWLACGALIVACRKDTFWAVDGQHRVSASMRRSDIKALPCLIFNAVEIKDEAKAFLSVNSERKPISAIQRHKALIVSENLVAQRIQAKLDELGLSLTADKKSFRYFACMAWAYQEARDDYDSFSTVLDITAQICEKSSEPIKQTLVAGFAYINKRSVGGLKNARILDRIQSKGAFKLHNAAIKSAILQNGGGARVWAIGILEELNKGLSNKIRIKGINEA